MNLIRLATPDDIGIIFDIRTRVKENHLSIAQLKEMGITPEVIQLMMERNTCVWVVEVEGIVVGFSIVDFDVGCIFATFVHT